MKRLLDRKIEDKTTRGYDPEQVRRLLSDVKEIDSFEFYYYPPGQKFPKDSKRLKAQPTTEVLSIVDSHFIESPDLFVEIQQKVYKSGKCEVILKGRSVSGEISKLAVLTFRKLSQPKT